MFSALLITLREGLEAALIVGIILAYLAKIRRVDLARYAWLGVGGAILVNLAAGIAIYATAGELVGRAEQVFEGSAMLLAVGVLTWMIFWMHRHAAGVRLSLQPQMDVTGAGGSGVGRFLASILGYNSTPSLTEVTAYVVYLVAALGGYFRPHTRTAAVEA